MADILNIMQQAQQMQSRLQQVQEDLQRMTVTGSAGGGMVTVYVNGAQEIMGIKINPEVVKPEDAEMLYD